MISWKTYMIMEFCSENDFWKIYFDDNNFIRAGLGGMGCSQGWKKKPFQAASLLEVDSKPEFFI